MASKSLTLSSLTLSDRLKSGTAADHRRVERLPFVQAMLRGTLPRTAYVRHLRGLRVVYQSLESSLRRKPVLPGWDTDLFTPLERTMRLDSDLEFLDTERWFTAPPAAHIYADRIWSVSRTEPVRLWAHAYVRYLGDLSGGQILRRLVVQRLGIPAPATASYGFDGDCDTLKARFREALDSLDLSTKQCDGVVDEARLAFALNGALFEASWPNQEASHQTPTAEATPSTIPTATATHER